MGQQCCAAAARPEEEIVAVPAQVHRLSVADNGEREGLTLTQMLERLEDRYSKVLAERMKLPPVHMSTHKLAELVADNSSIGQMKVISFDTLQRAYQGSSMQGLSYEHSTIDVQRLPADAVIVFVSHRWWSSPRQQADRPGWPKVGICLQEVASCVLRDFQCASASVYFWLDVLCINQVDAVERTKQLESIPIFVALSDAMVAFRAGDEDYCSAGGPTIIDRSTGQREKWGGNVSDHPGHYNNRVWTGVELFMATSEFQRSMRGSEMPLYAIDLDVNFKITWGPGNVSELTRSKMHGKKAWALPPPENLVSQDDLPVLELMLVLLGNRHYPRLTLAARYNLQMALQAFIQNGEDVNARSPGSHDTALMFAACHHNAEMVEELLRVPDVEVNLRNRMGRTACHALVTSSSIRNFSISLEKEAKIAKLLIDRGADPTIGDKRGRSAVDFGALRHKDVNVFEGYDCAHSLSVGQLPTWSYQTTEKVSMERKERRFPSGNVVAWRQVERKKGAPRALMVVIPTAFFSSLTMLEFATHVAIESGMRVVVLELPGTGHSIIREGGIRHFDDTVGPFTSFDTTEEMLDFFLKDITECFRLEGWDQGLDGSGCHLVGTSFGSLCAAHIAARQPKWTKSLTLFSWVFSYQWDPALIETFDQLIAHMRQCSVDEAGVALRSFVIDKGDSHLFEILADSVTTDADGFQENRQLLVSPAVCKSWKNQIDMHEISCPILVVSGEMDAGFIEHAYHLKQDLPHVNVGLVDKVAHIPPLENPVQSTTVLLDFIASSSAGAASPYLSSRSGDMTKDSLPTVDDLPVVDGRTVDAPTADTLPNMDGDALYRSES